MTGEIEVGVVEEVEVGVWRPPVGAGTGAGAGAGAATRLSEPVIPVRVLMRGVEKKFEVGIFRNG